MSQIIPQQDAIDVYANNAGGISIRQQSDGFDEPCFIYIHPIYIETLIRSLREAKKSIQKDARDCEVSDA